jgi:hypothetical protein
MVRAPAAFARIAGLSTPMLDLIAALAIRQARDKGLDKGREPEHQCKVFYIVIASAAAQSDF